MRGELGVSVVEVGVSARAARVFRGMEVVSGEGRKDIVGAEE